MATVYVARHRGLWRNYHVEAVVQSKLDVSQYSMPLGWDLGEWAPPSPFKTPSWANWPRSFALSVRIRPMPDSPWPSPEEYGITNTPWNIRDGADFEAHQNQNSLVWILSACNAWALNNCGLGSISASYLNTGDPVRQDGLYQTMMSLFDKARCSLLVASDNTLLPFGKLLRANNWHSSPEVQNRNYPDRLDHQIAVYSSPVVAKEEVQWKTVQLQSW